MIQLRLAAGDLERMRFDVSPMAEVVQSGRMLNSGRGRPPYQEWFAEARGRVRSLDTDLLAVLLPDGPYIADFLLDGPGNAAGVEEQLRAIADCPVERMREDLLEAWPGRRPSRLEVLLGDPGMPRRIADLLHEYWALLIEPHWRRMKAVVRDDVAYRATRLAVDGVGVGGMLGDLHAELSVADGTIFIDKPHLDRRHELNGAGLRLVPSVFSWPQLICTAQPGLPAAITYGCRAAATVWDGPAPLDDPLAALLGRTRAEILRELGRPRSTSDLAARLGHSTPAISQHLGVLRRAGMATSWRAGRRVLYQRSALATSMLAAGGGPGEVTGDRTEDVPLRPA